MGETVSVVMSVYNETDEWLISSIESILDQTYSNIQFIIVNDNPTNERIKKILTDYQARDERICLVMNEINLGLVASLNRALEHAIGNYIARMDADDISKKNRIEMELIYLKQNNLDFVMSHTDTLSEMGDVFYETKQRDITDVLFSMLIRYCNISTHPTWLMKRSVYDDLKGYRGVKHCEDYDFILRAIQKQYKVGKMKESLLFYRVRESSISRTHVLEQFINSLMLRRLYNGNKQIELASIETIGQYYDELSNEDIVEFNNVYRKFSEKKKMPNKIYLIVALPQLLFQNKLFRTYFFDYIKSSYQIRKRI